MMTEPERVPEGLVKFDRVTPGDVLFVRDGFVLGVTAGSEDGGIALYGAVSGVVQDAHRYPTIPDRTVICVRNFNEWYVVILTSVGLVRISTKGLVNSCDRFT